MGRVINQVVQYVNSYKAFVEWAKEHAATYPHYTVEDGRVCSNVRIERDKTIYIVLCVESISDNPELSNKERELDAFRLLVLTAHNVQHLHIPHPDMDRIDEDQRYESERLKDKMPWLKE